MICRCVALLFFARLGGRLTLRSPLLSPATLGLSLHSTSARVTFHSVRYLCSVAPLLQVPRIGPQHQAGSDSLLTATTFFKMRGKFFEDAIDPKYMVSCSPLLMTLEAGDGRSSAQRFGSARPSLLPSPPLFLAFAFFCTMIHAFFSIER